MKTVPINMDYVDELIKMAKKVAQYNIHMGYNWGYFWHNQFMPSRRSEIV